MCSVTLANSKIMRLLFFLSDICSLNFQLAAVITNEKQSGERISLFRNYSDARIDLKTNPLQSLSKWAHRLVVVTLLSHLL